MDTPIFAASYPGFMGSGGSNDSPILLRISKKRKLFGKVKRFYIHGTLEGKAGFDICSFISGNFRDLPLQDAYVISINGEIFNGVIVMVTSKNNIKYALLVENNEEEINEAKQYLWNGEWLKDGNEKYEYLKS